MKRNNKKILKRTSIIVIVLFFIIGILMCSNSYAEVDMEGAAKDTGVMVGTIAIGGIGSILILVVQYGVLIVGLTFQGIITALTALAPGNNTNITGIEDIIFNRTPITTASFFTSFENPLGLDNKELTGFWDANSPIFTISNSVSQYYYIIRNLSIAILLFVLLYIGIRMAISTVASDEAKYKKMLQNWIVSLALVFVLHYIMILTFYINNKLVATLYNISNIADVSSGMQHARAQMAGEAIYPVTGIGEAVIYAMTVGMEFTYFFMYIKRTVTLAFLIVIAPLITITYSIDKIGDGRSQALNTWLKEFIFTVLVQPFHCIIYIVLIQHVVMLMNGHEGIGVWIIYLIMLSFAKEAEKIIKKIFNIQTDSMPGVESMGALALGVMTTIGGLGKAKSGGGSGGSSGKKKVPDMKQEQGADKKGIKLGPNGEESVVSKQQKSAENTAVKASAKPKYSEIELQRSAERAKLTKQQRYLVDSQIAAIYGTSPEEISAYFKGIDRQRHINSAKQAIAGVAKWEKRRFSLNSGVGRLFTGGEGNTPEGRRILKSGIIRSAIGVGVGAMALGMADSKAAIGAGLTAYAASGKIEGAIRDTRNSVQLERNEDTFGDRYEESLQEYIREQDEEAKKAGTYIERPEEEKMLDAQVRFAKLAEEIENGTVEKVGLSAAESKFASAYSSMTKSYKIMQEEKPDEDTQNLMKKRNTQIRTRARNVKPAETTQKPSTNGQESK